MHAGKTVETRSEIFVYKISAEKLAQNICKVKTHAGLLGKGKKIKRHGPIWSSPEIISRSQEKSCVFLE